MLPSIRTLVISSTLILGSAVHAQQRPVFHLEAPDLPQVDRQRLLQTLQAAPPCTLGELVSKAAWTARDMGYFKAKAQQTNPEHTSAPPGEITIALNAGQQFHAGHITLHGNHVMAADKTPG